MVGRRSLIAIAASALLLVGGQSAAFAADDEGVPFQQLVQVYVPDMAAVDTVVANYDATEYKSVQDDGSILLAVFVTAEEKAALKAKGYEIGRVIEDSNTGAQRMKERQEIIDQEAVAADVAENGLKGARFEGRSVAAVPGQGDTVIQRADVFTNAVGPPTNRTTARFLYVEAHNKSTKRVPGSNTAFTGPALALSFAGPDGVYSTPVNMGRNIDNMLTPNEYMYHRQLVRLTGPYANLAAHESSFGSPPRPPPAAPRPAPRPSRSPSGSATTCRRTSRASGPSSSRSTRIRPRPAPTWTRWRRRTRS